MGHPYTPRWENTMHNPDTSLDLAAPISLPPGTIVGYVAGRPVYNIAGGSEDDTSSSDDSSTDVDESEPEPEADDIADDDEAPKPKPPADKKPETPDPFSPPSEAEWKRTQAALKKANEEGKRHRLRAKELEEKTRADETDHEKALREAREEGERRYRAPLVRTAARSALVEAGALAFLQDEKDPESQAARDKGESRLTRLLKLVDTETLDIDESGSVSGLEGAVDDLRRDYPELFAAQARRPKVRPTGAPRQPAPEKPKSTAEQHAARLLGRA